MLCTYWDNVATRLYLNMVLVSYHMILSKYISMCVRNFVCTWAKPPMLHDDVSHEVSVVAVASSTARYIQALEEEARLFICLYRYEYNSRTTQILCRSTVGYCTGTSKYAHINHAIRKKRERDLQISHASMSSDVIPPAHYDDTLLVL
jgi:hypothetical protein